MRFVNPQMKVTQPVFVQLLALTAWMYLAMATGPLVPAAHAGAFASVTGGGAESSRDIDISVPDDDSDGDGLATAFHRDMGDRGTWLGEANVFGPAHVADNIGLRAEARAHWVKDVPNPHGTIRTPGVRAFAQWTDHLQFENPDVVAPEVFTFFFVYFRPAVEGTISGAGSARFEVLAGDQVKSVDFDEPGKHSRTFEFRVPAIALRLGSVPLVMNLSAGAVARSITPESVADFSKTAVLPPLVFADADGNYVPGTEQLRIVGTSGFRYATRAVPEPATAALLAIGGLMVFVRRLKDEIKKKISLNRYAAK